MKVLFFATNSFPYGKGEPLVSNQIKYLSKDFDRIIIISSDMEHELSYDLPSNVEHHRVSFKLSFFHKFFGLLNIYSKYIREEKQFLKENQKVNVDFSILKVMLNSFSIGKRYRSFFKQFIRANQLEQEQLFFHSYWCTESVIGFCLLKNKYPNAKMDSRFHAYDLYLERHKPNYLPFRKLIMERLDKLIFISDQGKNYFLKVYKDAVDERKLIINRLGVNFIESTEVKKEKTHLEEMRLVTCSSLIDLKRIDLVIRALSEVKNVQIEWIHFGNGPLAESLEKLAVELLGDKLNIKFNFYGFIDNDNLQKYYHTNYVDLFLNTSKYEGVPISIMEAMSYKIPCVATNVGGVSEIVNSENGYLLPVDFDIKQLVEIIEQYSKLSKEEKKQKSESAYLTWKTKYNGLENYKALINEILPEYKCCSKCIYDNEVYPEIKFDEEGICEICHIYDDLQRKTVFKNEVGAEKLNLLLQKIKNAGKGKQYDCIIGVSGGVDSSYLAYLSKEWGLKPLILHVDNGWNSELATKNIENILKVLNYDLYTHVIDWEEMRDMQLAFFKASVVDIDLPFDNAFMAILYDIAKKYKIKYILSGHNTVTEGWMPPNFTHYKLDSINLKAIHAKFGKIKLKKFPIISPIKLWILNKIYNVQFESPLDLIAYNKAEVKDILINKLGWRDYGGKHYENIFTKFYQGYILPQKFNVDKRKAHLSTLICSGQITRAQALEEIKLPAYNPAELENDKEFFAKKMELSMDQFNSIMDEPIKRHTDFPSYINVINKLRKIKRFFIPKK
jgi:N-acetyl sugar amidotransferase